MKVIGFDDTIVPTLRITCRACAAIIQYLPGDVQRYSGTDYGGGPDGREWIVCPNCTTPVIIRSW